MRGGRLFVTTRALNQNTNRMESNRCLKLCPVLVEEEIHTSSSLIAGIIGIDEVVESRAMMLGVCTFKIDGKIYEFMQI